MRVAHLSLVDFRNYTSCEVDFAAGRNLLIGRNGQGKTNLVEAIGYLGSLRSHRVSADHALIRAGADAAVVRMRVAVGDREANLEIELNRRGPNRAQVNGHAVRPREFMRWFSTVLFAPEDLMIVRGEPSVRRGFLDDAIVARNPAMSSALRDYDRVVKQRTSLLKSARLGGGRRDLDDTLSIWDDQLVVLGSRIMHERRSLLEDLKAPLQRNYEILVDHDHDPVIVLNESVETHRGEVSRETSSSGRSDSGAAGGRLRGVGLAYVSRETIEQAFREALHNVKFQERERAVTLVGPHRDDLHLQLNDLPVKGYASHGESWSFALSLKLSLADLLRDESAAGDPVIILDDVFAELDAGRRERLMGAVGDFEQVIVTAAVAEDVPDRSSWRTYRVQDGTVEAERPLRSTEGSDPNVDEA